MLALQVLCALALGLNAIPRADAAAINSTLHARQVTSWPSAISAANDLLSRMSNNDKVDLVSGIGWQVGACVGNTKAVSSIGFPGLCLQDSPTGVRFGSGTSAFPASINVASTWDQDLMYRHGVAIGQEARGKGINVWLGPVVNMLRAPQAGRIWEAQGADPYLSGVSAAQQIKGVQSNGVIATIKHFVLNDQETNRETYSVSVDSRTLREHYLLPFQMAVDAGVGAVMCSYNRVSGSYSCENPTLMNILKSEMGFNGFVMTDWWATTNSVAAASGGSDMMMPGDLSGGDHTQVWGPNLLNKIGGSVQQSRLDDMARRVLSSWIMSGQNNGGFPASNGPSNGPNVQADHANIIREVGGASSVLLTNNGALPLAGVSTIAVVGWDARGPTNGLNSCADHGCIDGTVAQGWGSGTTNFPYLISPIDGISSRAGKANVQVVSYTSDNNANTAADLARSADVAIVFVAADSGEEYIGGISQAPRGDRLNLDLFDNGDTLVNAVAAVKKTIVVVHAPGPVNMPWANNPNVAAIIWAGMPGQETGNAIADVLFGDVNPSGRLVFTINSAENQYAAGIVANGDISYSEGLFVDYMWNEKQSIAPLFAFGHGLSYTTFGYSGLSVATPAGSGPQFTFNIANTGSVAGKEVAQVYIGMPAATNSPKKQLRGFKKVLLSAGASASITIPLSLRDVSIYDTNSNSWVVPSGTFTAYIGASSADIRVTVSFTCNNNGCQASTPVSTTTSSPTTTATITTTTPATTPTTTPDGWTYVGCYTDSVSNRQMSNQLVDKNGTTIESCESYCTNLGFTYAGLEYSQECFCSNSLPQLGSSNNCNMACTGLSSETCGGSNALSVYQRGSSSQASWSYIGCYTDSVNNRQMTNVQKTATNTVSSCESYCQAAGYSFSGLEYGQECWCGNSLPQLGTSTGCDMPCTGSSSQVCGGGNALSVYQFTTEQPVPPPINPWTYVGCFTDSVSNRQMSNQVVNTTSTAITTCESYCLGLGFKYAGLEYAQECYCSNSLPQLGTSNNCNMACTGIPFETCGGSKALSVYQRT